MFGDAPKHVKCFAAALISLVGTAYFAYQGESSGVGDPQFISFATTLLLMLSITLSGFGVIFLLFSGGDSSGGSQNGPFWKFVSLIGGIAGIITIVWAIRSCKNW